ncbi:MAG: PGF-pre-PGF domain-containing protein [Methanosarcina sp.]
MKSKTLFIVFILIFLMGVLPTVSARDIIVGNESGSSSTIQEAVDGAEAGDVIIIKPGIYVGNINVSKARLTIKPETNNVFIEPADSSKPTIKLSDFGTRLSGLNIIGSVHVNNIFLDGSKIFNENSDMSQITNNVIGGISVGSESSGIIISGNRISGGGIDVSCCGDFNEIKNNVISNCSTGIYVYDERNVPPIRDNKISNCDVGIHVSGLSYDIINNEITKCGIGVVAGETGGATLVGNKITYCTDCGVEATGFLGTNYNNYFNNTVNIKFGDYENTYSWNTTLIAGTNIIGGSYTGGNYWAKPDGTGFSQTAIDANRDGIADSTYAISEKNYDYLPLVVKYNSLSPTADFTANVTSGTPPLKVQFTSTTTGNPTNYYWVFEPSNSSDWNSLHAVTAVHTFKNPGAYTISLTVGNAAGNNTIVKPNYITVTDPKLPIANFSSNTTSDYAPLSVQFTDFSKNATWRTWYFGDGARSNEQNPVHVYATEGNYNVYFSASNENGTASKSATITVQKAGSSGGNSGSGSGGSGGSSHKSSGSSKSGGGGGAGGSPEPQSNVAVKELSQAYVSSGKPVKFDFTKNATCVVSVTFDSKKSFGKTTTIAEQLKGKSTLVSELPEGLTYKSFNVWVGNGGVATLKNIENGVVCIRVNKAWIKDKKIAPDSIVLNRYANKKWEQLLTTLLNEDEKYLYFIAQTPEFGSFVITGKEILNEVENKLESNEEATTKIQSELETETINCKNTGNKESQLEQKEKLSMPCFEISYGTAGLLIVFLYKKVIRK